MNKFLFLFASFLLFVQVLGHGHLADPPMRSSMWRVGFNTPPNYNDDGLNCGGFNVQWDQNSGLCGECGDDYALPRPRPNEAGGVYGNGIIVRDYKEGEEIQVMLNFSTNHGGFSEFRLCPVNDPTKLSTQECFDQHLLELADGTGTQYFHDQHQYPYVFGVKLPDGLTCTQCVFQWYWKAGNRWGNCGDGTEGMGCGQQESYRNCADVSIS